MATGASEPSAASTRATTTRASAAGEPAPPSIVCARRLSAKDLPAPLGPVIAARKIGFACFAAGGTEPASAAGSTCEGGLEAAGDGFSAEPPPSRRTFSFSLISDKRFSSTLRALAPESRTRLLSNCARAYGRQGAVQVKPRTVVGARCGPRSFICPKNGQNKETPRIFSNSGHRPSKHGSEDGADGRGAFLDKGAA